MDGWIQIQVQRIGTTDSRMSTTDRRMSTTDRLRVLYWMLTDTETATATVAGAAGAVEALGRWEACLLYLALVCFRFRLVVGSRSDEMALHTLS